MITYTRQMRSVKQGHFDTGIRMAIAARWCQVYLHAYAYTLEQGYEDEGTDQVARWAADEDAYTGDYDLNFDPYNLDPADPVYYA